MSNRPAILPHLLALATLALTATISLHGPALGSDNGLEPPYLRDKVNSGALPPMVERLPTAPYVVRFSRPDTGPGQYGGDLSTPIRNAKDVKLLVVYGYARLVRYADDLSLQPDILERVEVEDDRRFTLHLRPGHKWSDGHPFTAEDFRYWWEDVANNPEIAPAGPPPVMRMAGPARFEVLDETTVRYSWDRPNPLFLPALAASSPLFIYRPAHYLKQFHGKYADADELAELMKRMRLRNWAGVHERRDNMYLFNNPEQPTLQPWVIKNRPPAIRFIGERNPYFHRVDSDGRQLPYIDRILMPVVAAGLIPAKAGTGEFDLTARGLTMADYVFLRENVNVETHEVLTWQRANGSHIVLYPNMNQNDAAWRALFRDRRFRRALSLSIDREQINEFLFFGQARPGNNTVLAESPLYRDKYRFAWTEHDPETAADLLDELGLDRRDGDDIRLLPDGRQAILIAETSGERQEEVDALEIISSHLQDVGLKLLVKPTHRATLRSRATAGETMIAVWSGIENGLPTADLSPEELIPRSQIDFQWPKWGLHIESGGQGGEPIDMPEAQRLVELNGQWLEATDRATRERIWHAMLDLHADEIFSIGLLSAVAQLVVATRRLRNIPRSAIYNWNPGAFFGLYRPDTFWLASE